MIAVVDYHKGNLMSVERGLVAAGGEAHITDDPDVIRQAEGIVLPGVGSFADASCAMQELGQMEAVRQAVEEGKPFLGICLGLHLMFEAGTEHAPEGETLPGLGFVPGVVDAMPRCDASGNAFKIPHVGWNSIHGATGDGVGAAELPGDLFKGIKPGEYFYFTHSYIAPPSAATTTITEHSMVFPSTVQVPGKPIYGVQFHPEKSSDAGGQLLANFVTIVKEAI